MDTTQHFSGTSLIDLVLFRADKGSHRLAFLHLKDGKDQTAEEITYGELAARVQSLAAYLQGEKVAGERIILAYPSGIDYVVAYLAVVFAGAIAVPVFEPRQSMHASRLHGIIKDASPKLMLSNQQTARLTGEDFERGIAALGVRWLLTDNLDVPVNATDWRPLGLAKDDVVFLQYTSGSTGQPKGVKVSNWNLIHNSKMIQEQTGPHDKSCMVTWLPPYHDMGLIGGLLQPLYAGYPSVILSPVSVIQRPYKLLRAISDFKGTLAGGPNFIFDACTSRVKDSQLEGVDLSSWEVAFNGAEPIHAATLRAFSERFAPYGFNPTSHYSCYGLAENTLMVTGGQRGKGPLIKSYDKQALQEGRALAAEGKGSRELVSSGGMPSEVHATVVDPERCVVLGEREVGEIWVRGESTPAGYWQRELVPGEDFFGIAEGDNQHRYLRTGDLGFFDEGELFITGRIKDVIIIRGKNHYPQDIELTLTQSHPELKSHTAAAFSVEGDNSEQLAAVVEIKPSVSDQSRTEIEEAIREAIARQHELQIAHIHFIRPGTLPKTTSGKIQRGAARQLFLNATSAAHEAPTTSGLLSRLPQHQLAEMLEGALGDPNDPTSIMSYQRVMELDEREAFQEEFFQHLLALKMHHYYVPAELGGKLRSYEQIYALGKVLARRDLATAVTMSTMVWSTLVWIGGDDAQKRRCADLTMSIRGAQCLAYSEEHHGSDLLANECTATPVPGGFVLEGEKWPINRAARSDVVMLLAKTASNDAGGRSLSLFMVEKDSIDCSKFTYLPKVKTHGLRGCDICGIRFKGAFIPESALIGPEGKGLELAILAFQVTRTLCVALSVGALENNLRVVMDFALNRRLYRGTVFDIPNARHYLTGAFADLLVSDVLGSSLVRALHVIPGDFSVLSAVAKFFAPFKLDKAQKDLATVLGARFFFREKHKHGIFQKSLRDSQVVGLFDGSSEVNLYSLCTQLPLLARRQQKRFAEPLDLNEEQLDLIFDPAADLPRFDGGKLDLSCHGRDLVMESFPLALATVSESRHDSEIHRLISQLGERLFTRHRDNLAWINQQGRSLDIRSPEMFELAKQYCIVYTGVCAINYWMRCKDSASEFIRRGEWLAVALQRLLLELRVEENLPNELHAALAEELLLRSRNAMSYGVVSVSLPDNQQSKETH